MSTVCHATLYANAKLCYNSPQLSLFLRILLMEAGCPSPPNPPTLNPLCHIESNLALHALRFFQYGMSQQRDYAAMQNYRVAKPQADG